MNEHNDFAIIETTNRAGRPSKYEPEVVDRILSALADGLTQKQACRAVGICENTLANWREQYPELQTRMTEAREQARRKALATIKAAGDSDWRAAAKFLELSFQSDYRKPDTHIGVDVNAAAGNATIVCTEEQRQRLIELRERLLTGRGSKAGPLESKD